ncbi:hypothetical protein MG293_003206 [Ovis ammon polii]|uniref:Uncharacterized protein n=1 Tax=Ovis ammon polii TaxID=230172 RepID=A0AAD4UIK9_OVIAM|nr:hypothetical protein MG293_003206 [Ovis ammon polii]KAI4576869.1 hypothetical protein MJT46_002704 [Ovis ammon polii x Ovis aries]
MHTCLFFSDGDTEAQSEPIVPGLRGPTDPHPTGQWAESQEIAEGEDPEAEAHSKPQEMKHLSRVGGMEKTAQKKSSDTSARKKYEILESAGLQIQSLEEGARDPRVPLSSPELESRELKVICNRVKPRRPQNPNPKGKDNHLLDPSDPSAPLDFTNLQKPNQGLLRNKAKSPGARRSALTNLNVKFQALLRMPLFWEDGEDEQQRVAQKTTSGTLYSPG